MAGTLLGLVYATIVLAFPGSNRVYYGTFFGGMALAIAGPLLWWRSTRDDRPARWIALYLVAWGALIAFLRHS